MPKYTYSKRLLNYITFVKNDSLRNVSVFHKNMVALCSFMVLKKFSKFDFTCFAAVIFLSIP